MNFYVFSQVNLDTVVVVEMFLATVDSTDVIALFDAVVLAVFLAVVAVEKLDERVAI